MTSPDKLIARALSAPWRTSPTREQVVKAREVLDALRKGGWVLVPVGRVGA